jgi:SAM-dependent methyltransferase
MLPDLAYLRRIRASRDPRTLLLEGQFLAAQDLFFSVVADLGGSVNFDVADMREVHAVAAFGDVKGLRVLDIGCGSTQPYVLEDTFRDRYPPFFAEMLAKRGARVTGTDIRSNTSDGYDHRVLDCTKADWVTALTPPYDMVAALSLFNAPGSPFEHDAALCDRLMDDMRCLLAPDGLLIVTLRDDLFDPALSEDMRTENAVQYAASKNFSMLYLDGNCAWLRIPSKV